MAQRGIEAQIDLVELEKLAAMQATDEEIGAFFGVSSRTILRRRKHVPEFAEVMERGRAKGKLSMRRMQMKLLEAGNATMGVWLGKQYLGQNDFGDQQLLPRVIRVITIPKIGEEYEPPDVLGQPIPTTVTFASRLPNQPSESDFAEEEALSVVVDTENAW
jgi:hypothetical protein